MIVNLGRKENRYRTTLFMNETVLLFSWHSFCLSIDVVRLEAALFHNGHVQVVQMFGEIETDTEDKYKFMTMGNLGGAKFEGMIADFNVFGRPLSDEELLGWTLCQNQGRTSF